MRELLDFLGKRSYVLLFIILEAIALSLIINFNAHQKLIFEHNVDVGFSKVKAANQSVSDYFGLRKANSEIMQENASLRSELKIQSYRLSTPDDTTVFRADYRYISARSIQSSIGRADNFLLLDQGSESGIESGDGVVTEDGVIGIVHSVTSDYARVMSCLHRESRISAKLDGQDYNGYVIWRPYDHRFARLMGIPKNARVSVGTKLVTGNSIIFPEGHPVGEVVDVNLEAGSNFYDIKISLSADMSAIQAVYVCRHKDKDQLKMLLGEGSN